MTGNHAVVRLADEHRHILVARAGELNGVAHLVVVDEAAPVVEDVQVVARPCDDALFGRVVVGVGADLIAPLVAAGRRDAVQRRAVIKNHAVAEGRHVLAERRADARHAADALARRAGQRVDDAHDQHPDEREDQDRHADSALYGVLLFIFLLFLIVIHPVGVKRGVCAGEIGDAPIFSIHVSILSRKENAGLPPKLFFGAGPAVFSAFPLLENPQRRARFLLGILRPKSQNPKDFWRASRSPAAAAVFGFSSASPQVINRLIHTSVDIVDKLWTSVDNSGISPFFAVFTRFWAISQKSLIPASARRFPRDRPRPAARQPDRRDPCRSQTSAPG
ncbi:MAG: hypothetical protein ACLUHE_13995 [Christensenellales bacterium]